MEGRSQRGKLKMAANLQNEAILKRCEKCCCCCDFCCAGVQFNACPVRFLPTERRRNTEIHCLSGNLISKGMSEYPPSYRQWPQEENESLQVKHKYRTLKRKLRCLLYEQECFQEELRRLQRKLLRVNRDKR